MNPEYPQNAPSPPVEERAGERRPFRTIPAGV